ncbi:plakophilin-3-like [Anableps anableps]
MNILTSENVFLSTLQTHAPSTTYALPSDNQLGNGTAMSDELGRARRVQEQIKMKMAEKSTLPRQNGGTSHYAMSDYGGSSTMKYSTYNPSYSSKSSYMYSKTLGPRVSNRAEFSSRSAAPDIAQFHRMSVGIGGGGGGGYYQEDMRTSGFQGSIRQNRMDQDAMSVHSVRNGPAVTGWVDNSDAGSMLSERDATFGRQYIQSGMNGYGTQIRQGGGTMSYQTQVQTQGPTMHRSLSGTLARGATMTGGGTEIIQQQQSFKGPAHRTINRITNRNRASVGSLPGSRLTLSSGNLGAGGDMVDSGFIVSTLGSGSQGNLLQQRQGNLIRSMSIKSMQSVGKGMDIFGQTDMDDLSHLQGISDLDIHTAVSYLMEDDQALQVMGAAYIQHRCYNDSSVKDEFRELEAIPYLMKLFHSDNIEVRRFATGAMRNLIYQNTANKEALISENGISELSEATEVDDDELHKNITGILWNLSSRDKYKESLAKGILGQLSEKILIPVSEKENKRAEAVKDGQTIPSDAPSEAEIFSNTTGCLRNLSSGNEKTRKLMRETRGLVGSLVNYLNDALETGKSEEKGVENTVCILRNLSFQLYNELPPSMAMTMSKTAYEDNSGNVGCFTPNSKKARKKMEDQRKQIPLSDLSKSPKDITWLWHAKIVDLYHRVLKSCEINATTREAAIGALQNITSGEAQWPGMLCCYMVNQVKMMPTLLDLMRTDRNNELRSLTGVLRNISRNTSIPAAVDTLVKKLPENETRTKTSEDVVINICGVLNNMVMQSFDIAKKITENSGLERLMYLKKSGTYSVDDVKASRAAATVLANMYNYKKLHRMFKQKGFSKDDFSLQHF